LQVNLVEKMEVPTWFDFRVDGRLVAVAVLATLAAGFSPASCGAAGLRVDLNTALKDDSRTAAGMGAAGWAAGCRRPDAFSTMLLVAAASWP